MRTALARRYPSPGELHLRRWVDRSRMVADLARRQAAVRCSRVIAHPHWPNEEVPVTKHIAVSSSRSCGSARSRRGRRRQPAPHREALPAAESAARLQGDAFACDPLIEYPSVIAAGPRPGALFVADRLHDRASAPRSCVKSEIRLDRGHRRRRLRRQGDRRSPRASTPSRDSPITTARSMSCTPRSLTALRDTKGTARPTSEGPAHRPRPHARRESGPPALRQRRRRRPRRLALSRAGRQRRAM